MVPLESSRTLLSGFSRRGPAPSSPTRNSHEHATEPRHRALGGSVPDRGADLGDPEGQGAGRRAGRNGSSDGFAAPGFSGFAAPGFSGSVTTSREPRFFRAYRQEQLEQAHARRDRL